MKGGVLLWVRMPWLPAVPCVLNLEGKLASSKGVDSNRVVSILSSSSTASELLVSVGSLRVAFRGLPQNF